MDERLDRAMVDSDWFQLHGQVRLLNVLALILNHTPIVLFCKKKEVVKYIRKFYFENTWIQERGLEEVVSGEWNKLADEEIEGKIKNYVEKMEAWGKNFKSKFWNEI